MVRRLMVLACALVAAPLWAQVRWQPSGSVRFEADCSLTTLNCGQGNHCVDNFGGLGNARYFVCDPAADAGLGNFIAITNAGGGGGGPGFGTIGTAVADIVGDTLAVNDSATVDFTTADNPESLTAAIVTASIGDSLISAAGITTRSKLPSALAYEDELNVFAATSSQTMERSGASGTVTPLVLRNNPAVPAANDSTLLALQIEDSLGGFFNAGQLFAVATDVTDASEDADTQLNVIRNGVAQHGWSVTGSGQKLSFGAGVDEVRSLEFNRATADGRIDYDGTTFDFVGGTIPAADLAATVLLEADVGAGLQVLANTLSTLSTETDFIGNLGAGDLTCGSGASGRMAVNTADALQYCDGAATPVRRVAAFGTDAGEATGLACTTCVSDSEVDATGITTRSKLPSLLAYEDEANTFTGGFLQDFGAAGVKLPVTDAALAAQGRVRVTSTGSGAFYFDTAERRVALDEAKTVSVCQSGCEFSTIGAALTSITDASASNRYLIVVQPGIYVETVSPKSYVSIAGTDRNSVEINSSTGEGMLFSTADVTDVSISNLTVDGSSVPVKFDASCATTCQVWFTDVNVGAADFTQVDGIFFDPGATNWLVYVTGSHFRTRFDAITALSAAANSNSGSKYVGTGNLYEVRQSISNAHVISTNHTGIQIYEQGSEFLMTGSGLTENIHAIQALEFVVTNPTTKTVISLTGVNIDIRTTASTRTGLTGCVQLAQMTAVSQPLEILLSAVQCSITAAGTAEDVAGVRVSLDADHANNSIRWNGGRLVRSGGSPTVDVNNAETVSGFVLELAGLQHAGSYSGAGTVSAADTRIADFGGSLKIPRSDSALSARSQLRVPTATDGLLWFDSSERRAAYGAADGAALAGDSAAAFFPAGTLEVARGGTNLSAALDDNTMVGNATTWQSKALVDCDDVTGKLDYNSTTNTFACVTDAGGGGGGDNLRVEDGDNLNTFTAATDPDFVDDGDINFVLDAAATPDTILANVRADAVALTTDTTGNYVRDITGGVGLTASAAGEGVTVTLDTASGETGFLTSGALVCGAGTAGKAQVHTTPLQYCDNAATPALQYAAYGTSAGASTSINLTTNPANCAAGSGAVGIDSAGAAECDANVAFVNEANTFTANQVLQLADAGTLTLQNTAPGAGAPNLVFDADGASNNVDYSTTTAGDWVMRNDGLGTVLTMTANAATGLRDLKALDGRVSASVGYRIADANATAGRYLRGDGTNFVQSALAAAGIGDCGAGNFARTLNDAAAPTCAADDDAPEAGDYAALTAGDGLEHTPTGTLLTKSDETAFLRDLGAGDLACGAATAGQVAVNDADALQYCDGAATPVRRTAAFANDAGVATSASALAANAANCAAGSGAGGMDAAGAAEDCTNYAEAADTMTFTSKTLDVEGTGNVVTTVSKIWLLAATCQNATATANFDTPTANAPAAVCVTGTNTQKAYLDFDSVTDESVQGSLRLPSDFTGAVDANYTWLTTAITATSAVWCLQLVCVADAETGDPAFPAQATGNCVSDATKGTTNQYNDAADAGVTSTGCAAGEILYYRISRDPDQTSTLTDDLASDARLVGLEITLRRAQ